jgi:hypothetical protein
VFRLRSARFFVMLAAMASCAPAISAETQFAEITNWAGISTPLKIVISLDKQHLTVYRGTEPVASTRISTGRSGYRTPSGIFSILQKRKWHRSNIYSNAPMPYMQRLTWSGIALHEGYVPNHPASHGCIRLPGKFARQLFSMTELGAQVFITDGETKPARIAHNKLLQPRPLDLVTVDERDVMLRWSQEDGRPLKWIPLPVKASELQTVSYSAMNMSAPTGKDAEETAETPGGETVSAEREASLKLADLEYDLDQMEFYKSRSVEPLRILVTQRAGAERTRDVQKLLRELGHDPGDLDGYVGRDTRAAIRSFQEAHQMAVTGEVTDELVERLYKEAKSSPPPSGHIYVKQDRKTIFDAAVSIADPDKPLGTHLFTIQNFGIGDSRADWQVISANEDSDARAALNRVNLPDDVRDRLERLLTPGSSMIVSDGGLNPETNKFTDFIVVTN